MLHFIFSPSPPPSTLQKSALRPSRFSSNLLRSGVSMVLFLAAMAGGYASDLLQEKEEKASTSGTLSTRGASLQETLETQPRLLRTQDVKQVKPSGIQLSPGDDEALEAVLGTGNNLLLKMRLDVKTLKKPLSEGTIEIPARLFLTDFVSSPKNHPSVDFSVRVECESALPLCILPSKPRSFKSFNDFKEWVNQGYFKNEDKITYDFYVDPHSLAPALTQHLFSIMPGGYHFTGTHVVNNSKIQPESYVPTVSYLSERGDTNVTTITLGGSLYLDKKPYKIKIHQQKMPHRRVKETVFEKNGRRLYSSKWVAVEATLKATYRELPHQRPDLWPSAPAETYSVVQQKPVDQEKIKHLACLEGSSGKKVDISDSKLFFPLTDSIKGDPPRFKEVIARDEKGHKYIMQYVYDPTNTSGVVANVEASIKAAKDDLKKHQEVQKRFQEGVGYFNETPNGGSYSYGSYLWTRWDGRNHHTQSVNYDTHNQLIKQRDGMKEDIERTQLQVKNALQEYLATTGQDPDTSSRAVAVEKAEDILRQAQEELKGFEKREGYFYGGSSTSGFYTWRRQDSTNDRDREQSVSSDRHNQLIKQRDEINKRIASAHLQVQKSEQEYGAITRT